MTNYPRHGERILVEGTRFTGKSTLQDRLELLLPGLTTLNLRCAYTLDATWHRRPSLASMGACEQALRLAQALGSHHVLISRLHLTARVIAADNTGYADPFESIDCLAARAGFVLVLLTCQGEELERRIVEGTRRGLRDDPRPASERVMQYLRDQERYRLGYERSRLGKAVIDTSGTPPGEVAARAMELVDRSF